MSPGTTLDWTFGTTLSTSHVCLSTSTVTCPELATVPPPGSRNSAWKWRGCGFGLSAQEVVP